MDSGISNLDSESGVDPGIDPPLPPLAIHRPFQESASLLALIVGSVAFCGLLKFLGPAAVTIVLEHATLGRGEQLVTLLAALAASVLIHEGGHLLAAILLGFDVLGAALGPWRISRVNGSWTVRFWGGNWFAASVSALPKPKSCWPTSTLVVVAAGPLATLLFGAAALAMLLSGTRTGHIGCFLAFTAELNAVLFVLGLLPNQPGARVPNDARLFLSLLGNSSEAHNILLYQLVMQMNRQGFRPCFYRQDVIRELPRAIARPEMAAWFAQVISDWAFDRGDLYSADAWDKRAVDLASEGEPPSLSQALAHSACLDLILRNDVKASRAKAVDIFVPSLQPEWIRHRALAVMHLSAGNILEGMGELQRADFSLPRGLPRFDFEREISNRLRSKAKELSEIEVPLP